MIRYGAKVLPYGGWLTMPRSCGRWLDALGDSASFLNSQRLKGIHLAIKSGMLAAETAFDAMLSGDSSAITTRASTRRRSTRAGSAISSTGAQLPPGFEHGLYEGVTDAGIQQVMRGGNLGPDYENQAGYSYMRLVDSLTFTAAPAFPGQCEGRRQANVRPAH